MNLRMNKIQERGNQPMATHAIGYWRDGSNYIHVYPEITPNINLLGPSPYVVRISNKGWIPVNVLVFANSEQGAKERVRQGLECCAQASYHQGQPGDWHDANRAQQLLDGLKSGELEMRVEPYDINTITKVSWGSHDDIC